MAPEYSSKNRNHRNRHKEQKSSEQTDTPKISLTPLLDILMGILLFLLVQHASNPVDFRPTDELRLPHSNAKRHHRPSTTIGITKKSILVNQQVICALSNRCKRKGSQVRSASSSLLVPLYEKLKEEATKRKKLAKY